MAKKSGTKKNRAEEYFEKQHSKLGPDEKSRFESHPLYKLFYPKSIALVGVSNDSNYGAALFMRAIKSFNYPDFGNIYPINPKYAGEILNGHKCYDSLNSLPEPPDYVLCGLPATKTPELINQAIDADAKFVVAFTSGFDELGSVAGKSLHEKIVDILNSDKNKDSHGNQKLRLVGPNCLGVYNPSGAMAFFDDQPRDMYGSIAMISQSGGQAGYLTTFFGERNHSVRMCVSVGNMIDIKVADILDFYRVDPFTKAIACYLEGIAPNQGKRLFDLIKEITRTKPVVIWKAGKAKASVSAISSHTGALAGDARVFESAMRQAGAIPAHSMESLFDRSSALIMSSPLLVRDSNNFAVDSGNKIEVKGKTILSDQKRTGLKTGMIVSGGGFSVDVVDTFGSLNIEKAEFSAATIKKMTEVLPEVNTFTVNPVDLGERGYDPEIYKKTLEACAADENVNLIITAREVERFESFASLLGCYDVGVKYAEAIKTVSEKYKKPIFVIVPVIKRDKKSHAERLNFLKLLKEINVPSFSTVQRAASAAESLKMYLNNRQPL